MEQYQFTRGANSSIMNFVTEIVRRSNPRLGAGYCVLLIVLIQAMQGCTLHSQSKNGTPSAQAEAHSIINEDETLRWSAMMTKLKNTEYLTSVQFVSESHGWVISDAGSLYETTDGSKTWVPVKVDASPHARVLSVFFVTASLGWVVERNNGESILSKTSDGGRNWRKQHATKSSRIDAVRFINDQEGWAIGGIFVDDYVRKAASLILHTTDQGNHWADVSDNLNRQFGDADITDVVTLAPSKAAVLTADGKVFQTGDGGQGWQQIGEMQNEPQQSYFRRIGISENDRLWILGGADSNEGRWGLLALREGDNFWKKFRTNIYINDIAFVSNDEVFACGRAKVSEPVNSTDSGVILHSVDGGRTWKLMYQKENTNIKALAVIDHKLIYAVGSDSMIFHFRLET